jgi:hypothetical protein
LQIAGWKDVFSHQVYKNTIIQKPEILPSNKRANNIRVRNNKETIYERKIIQAPVILPN